MQIDLKLFEWVCVRYASKLPLFYIQLGMNRNASDVDHFGSEANKIKYTQFAKGIIMEGKKLKGQYI